MDVRIFQPGAILHEVIVGALRSKGTTFKDWCYQNKVQYSTARQATYGQSGGDKGKALLEAMIKDAGPEVVKVAYIKRMMMEAARLEGTAA